MQRESGHNLDDISRHLGICILCIGGFRVPFVKNKVRASVSQTGGGDRNGQIILSRGVKLIPGGVVWMLNMVESIKSGESRRPPRRSINARSRENRSRRVQPHKPLRQSEPSVALYNCTDTWKQNNVRLLKIYHVQIMCDILVGRCFNEMN